MACDRSSQLRTWWGATGDPLTVNAFLEICNKAGKSVTLQILSDNWHQLALPGTPAPETILNRESAAVLADHFLQPFSIPVGFDGHIQP